MAHLQLRAADGHTFSAYVAKPEGASRGAVVVIQEIFGVTGHIERVAEQFAAHGYLSIAPALFDRQERGVNLPYDEAGAAKGIALMQKADRAGLRADLTATIGAVIHAGAVGMVGYCWGGAVTYIAGCRTNLAAGVSYYPGRIGSLLDETPRCPMMFHFGEQDTHIPRADVERLRAAFPQGEIYLYAADHGFNCPDRASFNAAAATLAFKRTLELFRKYLG
jgi:carboxymethylenebutenolidase